MADYRNPTAVITGASSGFGRAVTERLLSEGWNVCMIARSVDTMKEIALNYIDKSVLDSRTKIIKCDVLIPDQILDACKQIKIWSNDNINFLFNNVGGLKGDKNLQNTSASDLDYGYNLNVKPTFLFTQQLLSSLKNGAKYNKCTNNGIYDASIINVSSIGSKINEKSIDIVYSITKSAINQLTKLNALDLSKYKIRVNCITPGLIPTSLHDKQMGMDNESVKGMYLSIAKITPLGKIGTLNDLVEMVCFLIDKKKSGWITGQIYDLDGGISLRGAFSMLKSLM
eukprot:361030_1